MNEIELLFTQVLNCQRLDLYLNPKRSLGKKNSLFIASALKRRFYFEPLPYILGKTEFMGLEFKVNKDVFIPRQETEILVEVAINIVRSSQFIVRSILELGTGSGCIAISLAKFFKNINIVATDISSSALKVACQNAYLNNVKINFLKSDLFSHDKLRTINFELIVANPPYIPTEEIEKLSPEISYEPRIALDGGSDGLDFYRRISQEAPLYLKKGGLLILEMGFNQRKKIENIFLKTKVFKIIEIIRDYNHIERVIVLKKECYG